VATQSNTTAPNIASAEDLDSSAALQLRRKTDNGGMTEAPYRLAAADAIAALGADTAAGLTTSEAQARLAKYGPNELLSAPPVPAWRKFLAQFNNPLVLLLLGATVVSFIVWLIEKDSSLPFEALAILSIVVLNAIPSGALAHFPKPTTPLHPLRQFQNGRNGERQHGDDRPILEGQAERAKGFAQDGQVDDQAQ
jgi:magnesium-transporting ATPase (P-type)